MKKMLEIFKKKPRFVANNGDSMDDGQALHLRRMKRIQKFLGNITEKELKIFEFDLEKLAQKYGYPLPEVSGLFEWLYKSYKLKKDEFLFPLEKAIKTAKTLGRLSLKMKKSDLEGVSLTKPVQ
jgi:hypothetical protein